MNTINMITTLLLVSIPATFIAAQGLQGAQDVACRGDSLIDPSDHVKGVDESIAKCIRCNCTNGKVVCDFSDLLCKKYPPTVANQNSGLYEQAQRRRVFTDEDSQHALERSTASPTSPSTATSQARPTQTPELPTTTKVPYWVYAQKDRSFTRRVTPAPSEPRPSTRNLYEGDDIYGRSILLDEMKRLGVTSKYDYVKYEWGDDYALDWLATSKKPGDEGWDPFFDNPADNPVNDTEILQPTWATAKYNYKAQDEDELSFKKGDRIMIYKETDDGWFRGALNKESVGWFPVPFVVEDPPEKPASTTPMPPTTPTEFRITSKPPTTTRPSAITSEPESDEQDEDQVSSHKQESPKVNSRQFKAIEQGDNHVGSIDGRLLNVQESSVRENKRDSVIDWRLIVNLLIMTLFLSVIYTLYTIFKVIAYAWTQLVKDKKNNVNQPFVVPPVRARVQRESLKTVFNTNFDF